MLYTMIGIDKYTGRSKVIYGHVTENVIRDFWQAYVDLGYNVIVRAFDPDNIEGLNHPDIPTEVRNG